MTKGILDLFQLLLRQECGLDCMLGIDSIANTVCGVGDKADNRTGQQEYGCQDLDQCESHSRHGVSATLPMAETATVEAYPDLDSCTLSELPPVSCPKGVN